MKKLPSYIACGTIAALTLSGILSPPVQAESRHPASYLVQLNGHTLVEKNPDLRLAPASLTKMMTALIVLERCKLEEVVTVSRAAARETGHRINLRQGQRLRVHDLLAAALISSANDASRALADHVAGNQQAFVAIMNAKAHALQLHNTHFTNVCGHDDLSLYSTAHDLAKLAELAMQHPTFADLVARPTMAITTVDGRRTFHLKSVNRLIGRYPGATGVKTGTTPNAGQCLVALAQRDDRRILLVLMRSRNRWQAAPAMLDAAFAIRTSAMLQTAMKGDNDEALPEGALVRDQEETRLREYYDRIVQSSVGERHPRRHTAVQRHAHHRKRVHKRR
ncbi:D-alanyl-D-alanine carboxypeptidase family protein [Geomonas sp.]|uniref:D-alanyl-D-alanine carboxypeptidase family protein n=1 Tax=Geomonas sp. TaxID=2651584 RepID=UPI002B4A4836|nr:D-alanyl-D-alanine carboxypeptidase family protein [Geomonas sp.]HJV34667.1 D-alanyl-D-alanine carboxypeptidase family protein [Geomonas sp.]